MLDFDPGECPLSIIGIFQVADYGGILVNYRVLPVR